LFPLFESVPLAFVIRHGTVQLADHGFKTVVSSQVHYVSFKPRRNHEAVPSIYFGTNPQDSRLGLKPREAINLRLMAGADAKFDDDSRFNASVQRKANTAGANISDRGDLLKPVAAPAYSADH